MFIQLKFIHEDLPGKKWQRFFKSVWPFYKKWFTSEGYLKRPGYMSSVDALQEYMPELMPVYEKLLAQAGGGDLEARFLTMYCPPPYMSGCSQMAITDTAIALLRNYDYHPKLFDGKVMRTQWLQPVIGLTDCTWGLLDGINASGLTASLTFGGRKITGVGFGVPLLIRYVLETCHTVAEGVEALCRVPAHMTYNVTLVDKLGFFATVFLAPDRPASVTYFPVCTNHQFAVEWQEYGAFTNTVGRREYIENYLLNKGFSLEQQLAAFMQPPLYYNKYEKYFGTLYTALYNPVFGTLTLAWPNRQEVVSFENFEEKTMQVNLAKNVSKDLTK